jgi:hypothetical protein
MSVAVWPNEEFIQGYLKERGLRSIHNFYHVCKYSSMFRLYICSHHQAGYRTLNKKTTKINTLNLGKKFRHDINVQVHKKYNKHENT